MRMSGAPAWLAVLAMAASLHAATGVVFDDRNGDGVRGDAEPGLASVEVSNGVDVAVTAADGSYQIADRAGAGVFVVKPRGWAPALGRDNLPQFHLQPGPGRRADFALHRVDEPDGLRALIFTDTQPVSPAEVGYLERGVVDKLPRRTDISFGVTLGDIVYGRTDLFGEVNAVMAKAGVPWYALPGNHDLVLGTPDEAAAVAPFEAVYGPSTYAFHAGPALFVALDDVRPLGGPRFIGGLREEQIQFLGNLLRLAPADEWVVLMMHIPIFSPDPSGTEAFRKADRLRLFALLEGRTRLLILSGHTHYQRHVMYGPADGWNGAAPLHDYNVAAACGGFWGGPRVAEGIPVSTMWDGTPPGYAVLGFHGDAVSLDYVPARLPEDAQLALHVPQAVAPGQGYVSFYANVFNGDDGWIVEARVDDRAWGPIKRILGWDPTYAAAFLAQDAAGKPLPGPRLPDPVVCYHLWRGSLPADLAPGAHNVEVRATDPQGRVFTGGEAFAIARP